MSAGFPGPVSSERRLQIAGSHRRLPRTFVPNVGQTDWRVRYSAHGPGHGLHLTPGEAVFVFHRPTETDEGPRTPRARPTTPASKTDRRVQVAVLRLRFPGANPEVRIEGRREERGRANFFLGNDPAKWRTNVPSYREVRYRGLWPGVDLAFRYEGAALKSEFHLEAGARVEDVRLVYDGADDVSVDGEGNLRIRTALGVLSERRPESHQQAAGRRWAVGSRFALRRSASGETVIGFELEGGYVSGAGLVIDPALLYSTYLGGTSRDEGFGIAVDGAGSAYVTGETFSTDFPTKDPLQPHNAGRADAFVAKLDPTGSALVYSTYLGGTGFDFGVDVTVDGAGNAYVTGYTDSADFPTKDPLQPHWAGSYDAFVAKLDPTGSALVYSTYLGGSNDDEGFGIAVDGAGNAHITGETLSTDFPTKDPLQAHNEGSFDAFVAKLDPTGSALVYSTYLGGTGDDEGFDIAVDGAGNAYVTGETDSTDFPTKDPLQPHIAGSDDAFVAKLDPTGSALVYSTYLGGTGDDEGVGIAVDGAGNACVTGETFSTDFPTKDPLQPHNAGSFDAFVTKLDAAGSALVYSTYLGGTDFDFGVRIAVDGAGNAYVTGITYSTDFPTANPLQAHNAGNQDAFVAQLDATGSRLAFSTYLGGSDNDEGFGIAVDTAGNVYVTGYTNSTDFPTVKPLQARNAGSFDAFIVKIEAPPLVEVCIEALKVFDNCADVVTISGQCDPLPAACLPLPDSFSVSCTLAGAECAPVAVVPHVPADGLANVTFRIDYTKQVTIHDTTAATPTLHCRFSLPHFLTETVSLAAPTGFDMIYQCDVGAFTCGPCIAANLGTDATPDHRVCCEVELCLEIQSKFPVKLLVWTSGYCEEEICRQKQGPALACPPTPLFPPQ